MTTEEFVSKYTAKHPESKIKIISFEEIEPLHKSIVKINCPKCGDEFDSKYSSLVDNRRKNLCNICRFDSITKNIYNIEDFVVEYNQKIPDHIIKIIGFKRGNKDLYDSIITFICPECGNECKSSYASLIKGQNKYRCSNCTKKAKLNDEEERLEREKEFDKNLYLRFSNKLTRISKYTNSKSIVRLKNTTTGKIISRIAANVLSDRYSLSETNFIRDTVESDDIEESNKLGLQKFVLDTFNVNIRIIKYQSNKNIISYLCEDCGSHYNKGLDSIKKYPCKVCSDNKMIKENEVFITKYNKLNKFVNILSTNIKLKTEKIDCKCLKCGKIFSNTLSNLSRGVCKDGCKTCSIKLVQENNRIPIIIEEFYKNFDTKYKDSSISLDENYDGKMTSIKVKCECGEVFSASVYNLNKLGGNYFKTGCKYCRDRKLQNLLSINIDDINIKETIEIIEFISARKPIKYRCKICGETSNRSYKNGVKFECKNCIKNKIKIDNFLKFKSQYEILKPNSQIKITNLVGNIVSFLCNKCNKEHKTTKNTINRGTVDFGCRKCTGKQSLGELTVQDKLDYENIIYKTEYSFIDLKGKNKQPLRFDFALFKNDQLFGLIEFDGMQHYEARGFMNEEKLMMVKYRDKLKNTYCESNNIILLRIPYWEFKNINTIIDNFLSENNFNN